MSTSATAGEALDRIERILLVAQDFDHGMPPSADLTPEINALRALPKGEVLAALREAYEFGRVEGSMAHTFVPRREGDQLRIVVTNRASGPICVNPLAFRLATAEVVTMKETRISVGFRDAFVVDGPLPCPRLSGLNDVELW